jgi:hypothetical protein
LYAVNGLSARPGRHGIEECLLMSVATLVIPKGKLVFAEGSEPIA